MSTKLAPEIRPLAEDEIPLLDAHLDPERLAGRHHDRFTQQQDGRLTYLIAWLEGIPIGHTMVRWEGTTDAYVAERISGCAHVEDLFVMPELRSRGIGTRILAHGERLARERGFEQIGLAVGIDNPRARALYERLGYVDTGFGAFEIGGTYRNARGEEREWREVCEYLVKGNRPKVGVVRKKRGNPDKGWADRDGQIGYDDYSAGLSCLNTTSSTRIHFGSGSV